MALRAEKVHERVYLVGSSAISHPADCSVYLIDGGGELALIDSGAGPGITHIINNVQSLGIPPGSIHMVISTHAHIDHIGGNAYLQKECCSRIFAHALDAERIETGIGVGAEFYGLKCEPCRVARKMTAPEEQIRIGEITLNALHIPGHTPGSIALWSDIEGTRILFGQDIHGPYMPQWGAVMEQVGSSLEKLKALNADILCEGHFGIFTGRDAVRKYIDQYLSQFE
ncbi:MAG: MBL fold metallo-hydrolase [Candidatus Abyssubacteria bacterium]